MRILGIPLSCRTTFDLGGSQLFLCGLVWYLDAYVVHYASQLVETEGASAGILPLTLEA